MRSDLVFNVSNRISNRFLLCRMLSASARKLHRDGVSTSQCISSSLLALKDARPDPVETGTPQESSQVEQVTVEEITSP
jgi:hypothetical protein